MNCLWESKDGKGKRKVRLKCRGEREREIYIAQYPRKI